MIFIFAFLHNLIFLQQVYALIHKKINSIFKTELEATKSISRQLEEYVYFTYR